MNDRCYNLCSGIHAALLSAGWEQQVSDDGYRVYDQTVEVDYAFDIRAYVQDSYNGLCDGGDIGIAWLEIRYNESDMPYHEYLSPCDFKFMKTALAVVEQNLLRLRIPFSDDYTFECDSMTGINLKLRDELKVDDIYDEFRKELINE